MKKMISMILVLVMAAAILTACGSQTAQPTTPAVEAPASALEILETVWGKFTEDEKFPVIGGSMAAPVNGAPGSFDLADENISYSLLIPADQLANVTEAASMIHMMNNNTFTCAAFRLAEGVSAADFGAAMKDAVMNNQWMCGFPETLMVYDVAGTYVVVVFGVNDVLEPFAAHMAEGYPDAQVLAEEPIV